MPLAVAAALALCLATAVSTVSSAASGSSGSGRPPPPAPPNQPGWEPQHRHDGGGFPYTPPSFPDSCLGEFSFCSATGACVLDSANATMCAACKKGQYLCPLPGPGGGLACAASAESCTRPSTPLPRTTSFPGIPLTDCLCSDASDCPGLKGTHLDHTLHIEARLGAIFY